MVLQEVEKYKALSQAHYDEIIRKSVEMRTIVSLLATKTGNIQNIQFGENVGNIFMNNSNNASRKIEIGSVGRDFNASGHALNLGETSINGTVSNSDVTIDNQGETTMTGDRTINTSGGNYNERIEGDYVQGNKYAGQPQTLAAAAAEIQTLLKQLEKTYPTTTTSEQMVVAARAVNQIETNPLLKQRIINALKEGSLAAFEKAIDNPVGAFVVHAIQGWQEVK